MSKGWYNRWNNMARSYNFCTSMGNANRNGSDLKSIYDALSIIEARYKHPKGLQRVKTKLKAQSDQDQIADCTRRLDGSFQQLTVCVVCIYRQATDE
jgi:hypothetical protein